VTLSSPLAAALSGLALLLLAWSAFSSWSFVSREGLGPTLLEDEAGQKRAYENRIVALRIKLEEVSTQRMVEQEQLETRLKDLLARQTAFEARQERVQSLSERIGGSASPPGSIERSTDRGSASGGSAAPALPDFKPRMRETGAKPLDRRSDLHRLQDLLDRSARNLATLEESQRRTLDALVTHVEGQVRRAEAAIRAVGLNPGATKTPPAGLGGPLVSSAIQGPIDALLQKAEISLAELERLQRGVAALPFGEPIRGEADLSSGFGYRLDPFTRSPAMHTGLDFKADYGAAARAAGDGRVVLAELSGAYGNMVEVEHAQGVTSRYAHLSSIGVSVGQVVRAGAVLGRVGSTGRSTGPHLHFETRINGDAVDPHKFLRAATALAPIAAVAP